MKKKLTKSFMDVLNDLIADAPAPLGQEEITVQRVVDEARKQGKTLSYDAALRRIRRWVNAGILCPDGKRTDPRTKYAVSVWVIVDDEG